MVLISAYVTDEMMNAKINQGVKWSWLILQGLEQKERKERSDRMIKMIEELTRENDDLKKKIKDLERYLLKGGDYGKDN